MELAINLDETQPVPLYRQLYDGLRQAILSGRLAPGQKVPSTRSLARQLSISRNTVAQAYAELEAEGYVLGRQGSGSYVSSGIPDDRPVVDTEGSARGPFRPSAWPSQGEIPEGGRPLQSSDRSVSSLPFDFHPGQGAWDSFPREVWRRLMTRQWRRSWQEAMNYGDPAGYRPLREEVAAYLGRSRAVRCTPEEVVIVNGTQQALDLLSRILLRPGDPVAVENPGYPAARQVFASYGARILPISVDRDGLVVDELRGTEARVALVSPSHQFPTGAVLSLSRRLSLLAWARARGGLVVEDDYDSEFRFEGRPLASLQGLDDSGAVVYLGSFSKVLFPALRVGYAVLPKELVGPLVEAKELTDRQTPILEQQVLAGFLGEGHFERHLRRMRLMYHQRRRALVDSLEYHLGDRVEVLGASAGMHLMIRLKLPIDGAVLATRAAAAGVAVYPASRYYCDRVSAPTLVMGYAGMPEAKLREGVARLAEALKT